MMKRPSFHLAFPSHDFDKAKKFYVEGLGCKLGRSSSNALIFNLSGHQIVAQKVKVKPFRQKGIYPRHYGLIFYSLSEWKKLLKRAQEKKLKFYQDAKHRYAKTPLEHRTFFIEDPSHNLLEFKHYTRPSAIFGKKEIHKVGNENRK